MTNRQNLSEQELRGKLRAARAAFEHQNSEESLKLGSLALSLAQSGKTESTKVGGKQGALTAMGEEVSLRLALIEFIDSLDLNGSNKSVSVKELLRDRHTAAVMNLERAAAEVAGRATDIIAASVRARSEGITVPLGEKVRKHAAGEHARMMKDLAIVGFIQQFGITSRSLRTNKL